MEGKGDSNFDIFLYALGFVFGVLLLIISNKLVSPLIVELNSGAKISDLMSNFDDNIKFSLHLFVPVLLSILGLVILLVTFYHLVKSIIFQHETILIKAIMIILSFILLFVLIKALINFWTLFVIFLACLIISAVILAILNGFLGMTATQKS